MSDPTYLPIPLPQETNDKRPLPEIIADHYGFALAYHDVDDQRYYAVQDWIRGVSQTRYCTKVRANIGHLLAEICRKAQAILYWGEFNQRGDDVAGPTLPTIIQIYLYQEPS